MKVRKEVGRGGVWRVPRVPDDDARALCLGMQQAHVVNVKLWMARIAWNHDKDLLHVVVEDILLRVENNQLSLCLWRCGWDFDVTSEAACWAGAALSTGW